MRRRNLITGIAALGLASSVAVITSQPSSHTSAPSPNPAPSAACGTERWPVKTGTDPAASQVNLTPIATDISTLRAIPAPIGPNARVSPTEFKTYTIHALLTYYTVEADSDYHLVLVDPQAQGTMIGEIPSPLCAAQSAWLSQISASRKAFDGKFTPRSGYQSTTTMVTVTGVGFFDKLHGQRGVANNGIELHPVLSISFQ